MAVVALTTFALKKLQSAVSSCLTHLELFCPLFPFLVDGITKHAGTGKTAALPACWRGAGRGRCCSIIILLVDMTAMIELYHSMWRWMGGRHWPCMAMREIRVTLASGQITLSCSARDQDMLQLPTQRHQEQTGLPASRLGTTRLP